MSFRLRLSLLFVATLVGVQIFTALLIYGVARRAFIAEGERQLSAGAAAVATEPEPVVAPQTSPTFAAAPSGSMGRHEAMAMAGPTPDNPFATLQKRLARARFLDRQERAEYDATLAARKDMRRTPVSAREISQRAEPAAPAEQEVRRLEPGRTRKELKPGWTRN